MKSSIGMYVAAAVGFAMLQGSAAAGSTVTSRGRKSITAPCDSSTLVLKVAGTTQAWAWVENGRKLGVRDGWSSMADAGGRDHAPTLASTIGNVPILSVPSDDAGWIRLMAPARDAIFMHVQATCGDDRGVTWCTMPCRAETLVVELGQIPCPH